LPGGKAGPATLFHFLRKFTHGCLCDDASFAAGQRSLGIMECGEEFRSLALAFFPRGKGSPDGVFLTLETSALHRLADKRFLIGAKMHFHSI
jgi:hypothetical protein